MTTIAIKNGVIAADSLVTEGRAHRVGTARKLHRAKDGSIIGLCGDPSLVEIAVEWFTNRRTRENPPSVLADDPDTMIIRITPEGEIEEYVCGRVMRIESDCYAFGSGTPYALGAMKAGASAIEAVRIAADLDLHTGGDIVAMTFGEDPNF